MKKNTFISVTEVISWLALANSFLITYTLFAQIRRSASSLYKQILLPDTPLPALTRLALDDGVLLPGFAISGIIFCLVAIWLRRFEAFRAHQPFILTLGWIIVFTTMAAFFIALWMPIIAATTMLGAQ
ncbi:MAG: hypothetical protein QM496_06605 [Verrucomicrobiota bacterium]